MKIAALSSISAGFPTLEVGYEDMLEWRYLVGGRSQYGIDCLGVVLEILRRAGLGLEDPKFNSALEFEGYWDEVANADTLYDAVQIERELPADMRTTHLGILVRQGQVLSATEHKGVHIQRLNALRRIEGIKFFRIRPECLP